MPSRAHIVTLLTVICCLSAAGGGSIAPAPAEAVAAERGDTSRVAQRCKKAGRGSRACRRARARERRRERRERRRLRAERPFARDSFWNAPLADDAAIDPKSPAYVGRLQHLLGRWDPYVNTTRFSTPVYTVPADQPTVRVELDKENSDDLQVVWERVPIPRGARPAAGSDGHMVVWQPATDTMWEFWIARRLSDGWHARYGGRMTDVSKSPGHYRAVKAPSGRYAEHPRWGATGTSLPLLGGLMRIDELKAGRIDHALALALPEIRAGAYSWPAQRSDGESHHADAIPEGARFRIDPTVDLSRIPMSPIVRSMALAAQRYGIVVRDGAGAVTFYAEDPSPKRRNPFLGSSGLFGGDYISEQLRSFPWEHLQVLKTDISYDPDTPAPGLWPVLGR